MLLARCLHLKKPPRLFARHYAGKRIDNALITFRPESIVALRQPPIDLSNQWRLRVLGVELRYSAVRIDSRYSYFPADTRGFLYYHPGSTAFAGELRLRICPDASSFDAGRDLLVDGIKPWSKHVVNLVRNPKYAPLVDRLVQESLVSRNTVEILRARLAGTRTRSWVHIITALSDPFYVDLDKAVFHLNVVTEKHQAMFKFPHMFSGFYQRGTPLSSTSPFTGILKVRFELSKLPEHASLGPTLVLKFLEAHNLHHIRKDITIAKEPVAGEYHYRLPGDHLKMWRLRIDKIKGAREVFGPLLDMPGVVYAE